jgi:hypothetical protein
MEHESWFNSINSINSIKIDCRTTIRVVFLPEIVFAAKMQLLTGKDEINRIHYAQ